MVDWSPFGGNPVPGDPGQVKTLAGSLHAFAQDVDGQNSLLKALQADSTGVWEGPAADAFRPHLSDLPPKLDKLVTSYREAGDALTIYAPKLQAAQDDAVAALKKATEAMTRLGQARTNQTNQAAANAAAARAATPQHPLQVTVQADYGAVANQAQADLDAAHRAKDAAVGEARRAAGDCIGALKHAADDGIKNKHHHWWDTVVDVLTHPAKLLKVISMVANALSGIFGILALLTCWIPGVGEFFEAASLVTGLIGLAADFALACMGKGSWSSVLTDAVAVGTAGVGHVLGEAAGASRVVAEGQTAVSDGESALAKSAALKSEAKTMLATGKGGRAASGATKAEVKGMRIEAGELSTAGNKLVRSGNAAIDGASNPLKYGAKQTADEFPGRTAESVAHPYAAFQKGGRALKSQGVRGTLYDYVGYGDPTVATYRYASAAAGGYSAAVAVHASGGDLQSVQNGTVFDPPGSLPEQVTEFENNTDPFVLAGLNPPHGGG